MDLRDRGAHKRSVKAAESKSGVFRASSRSEDMFGLVIVGHGDCTGRKSGVDMNLNKTRRNLIPVALQIYLYVMQPKYLKLN